MEILIEDIPPEGLDVEATEATPWLAEAVREGVGQAFDAKDPAHLRVSIHRVGANVTLDGTLEFTDHPACDRCVTPFAEEQRIALHAVLAPLYESRRQEEREGGDEVELVKEDLEFGYYEGDRFDLAEIVREQALLAQPMKHLCREDCKGLCQRCGKDLNEGLCGCAESHADPRWAVLKDLKLKKS